MSPKEKKREYDREYRKKNKEKIYLRNREWRKNNPEKALKANQKYRTAYPEKVKTFLSTSARKRHESYEKNIHTRLKYMENNAEKLLEKRRKLENRERLRELNVLRTYKITKEQHVAFLEKQNYMCAMAAQCGRKVTYLRSAIDHDHSTGRVRGILCISHNSALAVFGDCIEGLLVPKTYFETAEERTKMLLPRKEVL